MSICVVVGTPCELTRSQEYISRPTARAHWWKEPDSHVLGGRDLQRETQGTWLGVTKQGRVAVLTNFREKGQDFSGLKSRGGIVNSFLQTPPGSPETTEEFAKRLVEEEGVSDVGGFSLAFGKLRSPDSAEGSRGLAIISNRTPDIKGVTWIADQPGQVYGLSNSHYGDLSWPKVVHGEQLLKQCIHANVSRNAGKDALLASLFDVLSVDTLPKQQKGDDWETYIGQLRNSIFIPLVGGEQLEAEPADAVAASSSKKPATAFAGSYGTQKQTVLLVDTNGKATFVEKTLYGEKGMPADPDKNTRVFEFDIEGWTS